MSVVKASSPGFFQSWQPLRGSERTLVSQLEDELISRINQHVLRPGSRLPSVRKMAESAGISRFTVVEAYDRLVASGLVEGRQGSGYFVRIQPETLPATAEYSDPERSAPSQLDISWLIGEMVRPHPKDRIPAAAGLLPQHWLNAEMINAAVRAVGRGSQSRLLEYGDPRGLPSFREQTASRLQAQGVPAHADRNILTVAGVTHGLDLVLRLLVQPGDTVFVEEPGWFLIFGRLAAYGVRIVGIPRLEEGPDLRMLERLAQIHKPRLFLINSVVHNPTGHTLGVAAAHDVLMLAERHDFLIVEDDTYSDFYAGAPIRLAAMGRLERVILVSGYAKTLAAGLRVGFLAARPDLIARLTDLKMLAGLTTSSLGESVTYHLLHEGHYNRHLLRLRQRVDHARHRCVEALQSCGLRLPSVPQAGIFVWADCGYDSELVARLASERGILLAPGTLFSPEQASSTMLRFSVSAMERAELWPLLRDILDEASRLSGSS
ncbi:PLP-dependent aminotransferase family protein [Gluconobacter wancherniae]|uniref:aminotransferase-like domain-containing protein n=1 Tax=Gluconobacter wancherniae TaxID=1307955 RepID=UPI0030A9597B